MRRKIKLFFFLLIVISGICACTDQALVDVNSSIPNRNWDYGTRIRQSVTIKDADQAYNVYLNLRHTANYRYSNIFVLISQYGSGMKKTTERREFKVAYPDGEWLGSGSGNFYSYQLLFRKDYHFPKPGIYTFEFEQNMRDNPLHEICDIGLRVEPVQ